MGKKKRQKNKAMRRANGTGAVYNLGKRRRKPWLAMTSKMVDGKQEKTIIGYFETKTEAEDALAINKITPASKKANYTLKQLYDEWSELKYSQDIAKSTIDNYKAGWKYLALLEKEKFSEIRAGDYQNIIDDAGKTKSRSTLEKIKTVVVMLSDYGLQNDIINKNYGSFIILPKSERTGKKSFTTEELSLIEEAAKSGLPFADCVLMMCYTGFRITEFLSLKSKDYNRDYNTLQGGIKTRAGENRIVPVHAKIKPYLEKWIEKEGNTIICKEDGSKYRSDYFRENCFKPCLEQIQDVRKLSPHECRHTFASLLHAANVSKSTLMELMGHDDPDVAEKTYIHVDIKQLQDAIAKL